MTGDPSQERKHSLTEAGTGTVTGTEAILSWGIQIGAFASF